MDFEKTGVPGLDEIFKGGIRKNSSIIVKGGPGTGKTILALQFIVEGAKRGQPGLFISAEEELDDFRLYAKSLGIDLEKYEKQKLIFLVKQPVTLKRLISISVPLELIRSKKVKRVVLDSLTLFKYGVENELGYRKEVLDLINNLREVLFLATAEETNNNLDDLECAAEDYLFDGIVRLTKVRDANVFERALYVSKMRGQDHLINIFPFIIKKNGIEVYPKEIPFTLVKKGFRK
ncbi:AAA family ATPase [Candidatus Woesearchaeota archaeon]|nr:AAA family ATPase [Candidatus Woesearchaeota archaeon]